MYQSCDANDNAYYASPCSTNFYCVKNAGYFSQCAANFPMDNEACLARAVEGFICTENGQFPGILKTKKF